MVASLTSNRSSNKPRVKAQSPPNVSIHERDPNTRDYFNFTRGDIWINLGTTAAPLLRVWILMRQAANVATWILLSSGANGDISQLTASDATIATPILGNITFPDAVIAGSGNLNSNLQSTGAAGSFTLNLKPRISLPSTTVGLTQGAILLGGNGFLHGFGTANTFVGNAAGNTSLTVVSAVQNTGIGNAALDALTTGASNTALGANSLTTVTTGSNNTGLGNATLSALLGGSANVAVGASSMNSSTSAVNNTAVGTESLAANLTGNNNTAIGYQALAAATASNNTAVGFESCEAIIGGSFNTGIGIQTLQNVTSGNNNTALGYQSLINLVTGSRNTVINGGSAYTGAESDNLLIDNTGVLGENQTIRIGSNDPASSQTRCFIAGIRGITTGVADAIAVLIDSADQLGTVSSSLKYKQNIQDMGDESSILMQLRPVVFNYKHHPEVPAWGLIAEEVETVFPQLVVYKNDEPETVKYHELVPLMLNEIQKLNKRISILEGEICNQKAS